MKIQRWSELKQRKLTPEQVAASEKWAERKTLAVILLEQPDS